MISRARVLLCDHLPIVRGTVAEALRVRAWQVTEVGSSSELEVALVALPFDVALVDPAALDVDARRLPALFARLQPGLEVLVMTHAPTDGALAAMGDGAADYVQRPFLLEEIEVRLLRLARDREHRRELERLRAILYAGGRLRGLSQDLPSMRHVCEQIRVLADQTAPVLVTGERGTGKKLVAAALHELATRRAGPFVTIRCLDGQSLSESHALEALAQARNGTLLVHGIENCGDALQKRLFGLLCGVGESTAADPRIVATAALDLGALVADGRFRGELWNVLRRLQIHLPPLRRRSGDILALAREFLQDLATRSGTPPKTLSAEAAAALQRHSWPGNVSELHHALATAASSTNAAEIGIADLPGSVLWNTGTFSLHLHDTLPAPLPELTQRLERELVEWALERAGGDRDRTATILGVPSAALERLLARNR